MYNKGVIVGGSTTGIIAFIGLLLIMSRRFTNDRVKATSSSSDKLIAVLLFAVMLMGLSGDTLLKNRNKLPNSLIKRQLLL